MTGRRDGPPARLGRLTYRPGTPADPEVPPQEGDFSVEVAGARPARVLAPAGGGAVRLVVLLHGAGGAPERTLGLLRPYAERHRLLLVAPASRGRTWDAVTGVPGPDVRALDEVLPRIAAGRDVRGHTIAGFSDGASYALTLGLTNGDVFDSVIAFSPGFQAARSTRGRPRVFVSHGTGDQVLPIEVCSRRVVPSLRADGYEVTYEEFEGGHDVPEAIRDRAVAWLSGA